jgi:hypothetical protein
MDFDALNGVAQIVRVDAHDAARADPALCGLHGTDLQKSADIYVS